MKPRFTPKRSVMEGFHAVGRLAMADRIKRIRARLADGWRHADWEQRLWSREQALRRVSQN
jgi:hypothetical protein